MENRDAEFQIDSVDINQLSFCAKVLNINRTTTNVSYTVEDGTGQVDVRQWIEASADEDGQPSDGIEQDSLVRIVGTIKVFHNKRSINAISVRKVTDMNEQQFHLLEAIYVHLYNTKGPLVRREGMRAKMISLCFIGRRSSELWPGRDVLWSSKVSLLGFKGLLDILCSGTSAPAANQFQDLPPAQRKIMQYIASLGSLDQLPQEGIDVQAIVRSTGIDYDRVKEEVDSLVQDGQLYTTNDEDQ